MVAVPIWVVSECVVLGISWVLCISGGMGFLSRNRRGRARELGPEEPVELLDLTPCILLLPSHKILASASVLPTCFQLNST
jgi:hypothetical protein